MSANDWDDPAQALTRASSARAQGDSELAYQLYARASELNPQETRAWQGRAETAASTDEALVSYAYAYALDPSSSSLERTLEAAIAQRVHDADRQDVPLLVALGQELAEVGLDAQAQTLFERAIDLDPSCTDAFVWLAGISDEDQKQLDYLNRAMATNPRDPRARAGLMSVKLPSPPAAAAEPQARRSERLAALASHEKMPSAPATALASDTVGMERLRRLRANLPTSTDLTASGPATRSSQPNVKPTGGADNRMRNLLLALVVVALVLAAAAVLLMMAK
jgi:tetratricopeptide (TPR) repeat protein